MFSLYGSSIVVVVVRIHSSGVKKCNGFRVVVLSNLLLLINVYFSSSTLLKFFATFDSMGFLSYSRLNVKSCAIAYLEQFLK